MAHKREEEAELKVPETHLTCTSSLSLSAIEYPDSPIPSRSDPPTPFSNSQKSADRTAFSSFPLPNRCAGCRRKVGLMGFRCRCGDLFCTEHRYSDRHDCSFDYKAAGREAIARDNPVVRPAKLLKV